MRLLVINPNTSASVSALLQARLRVVGPAHVEVEVVTARLGAPYIASECSFAVAGHAALDAWAVATQPPAAEADAVLIGCFGDPGLFALRECSVAPVTGLAEASFRQAAARGPFAIVTGGAAWAPMLRRHAQATGHSDQLVGVHTVEATGAALAADRALAQAVLSQACREAAAGPGVQSIIVGGAGLAGMAEWLQPQVPLPLIDSVDAGLAEALAMAAVARPLRVPVAVVPWTGVSAELARWSTARSA